MKKYCASILTICCFVMVAKGQSTKVADPKTIPVIETDRPDQTETPFLTAKNHLQFEWGFTRTQIDKNNLDWVSPTLLSKYAFSKNFEVRLITELGTIVDKTSDTKYSGITPVQIGGKVRLIEEKGWVPKTSLIFHVALPKVAGKNFKLNKAAPNFRFVMQNTISETMALGYNVGAEWDGFTKEPTLIYTFAPGFNLSDRLYYYIEAFGFIPTNSGDFAQHSMDMGFAYKVNNDTKFDISGGMALNKYAPDWYFAIGGSIRFKLKK